MQCIPVYRTLRCVLQQRRGISTGLASSVSSSRKARQTRSGHGARARTCVHRVLQIEVPTAQRVNASSDTPLNTPHARVQGVSARGADRAAPLHPRPAGPMHQQQGDAQHPCRAPLRCQRRWPRSMQRVAGLVRPVEPSLHLQGAMLVMTTR